MLISSHERVLTSESQVTNMGDNQKNAAASDNFDCETAFNQERDSSFTKSAHTVNRDSWVQVGVMLVTSYCCGYIFSFSNLIFVPLGWLGGIVCMVVVASFSVYGNCLLAENHEIGGQRFIRYRDLMGHALGRKMYYTTWCLQYTLLLLGNTGFILLSAKALKETDLAFNDGYTVRLQAYIFITGAVFFIFAFLVPTMSAMRQWLGLSVVMSSVYIATVLAISARDGMSNSKKNYDTSGTTTMKVFNSLSAIAAVIFCSNSGMIPEIQSTLRPPAIKNMKLALYLQFSVGLAVYYGVAMFGYWAYGSAVSSYLPAQFSGPKWALVLANLGAFVQAIISQHMFCSPVHETLDTKFLQLEQSLWSFTNIKRRFLLRAAFFAVCSLVAAAFPFIGDFVNLTGSFCLIPLTFVFPSMVYIKVKGKAASRTTQAWHWVILTAFTLLTILTTIAAVRSIVENIRVYHIFVDN